MVRDISRQATVGGASRLRACARCMCAQVRGAMTHPQRLQLHALLRAQAHVGQLCEKAVAGVAGTQAAQPRV